MELKSLMLWRNDFKHDRDWLALCESLDLPASAMEIELKCIVCVAKSHYTRSSYEDNNNGWPSIITKEDKNV